MVKGGAAVWKNCSAWSLEKMIQRSGLSARSRLPMSAATSRTFATTALSSVSGRVKNWGACGSIAPPITVDCMAAPWLGEKVSPKWRSHKLTRHAAGALHTCKGSHYAAGRNSPHLRRSAARQLEPGASMADLPITIACGNYDRTKAIIDGRVKVEGCDINYLPLYPEEIFHRMFKFQEFDVAEMSFSSYIRTVGAGTSEYIGIPAFVSRLFRHSGIYVREGSGINKPEDLRGKRIGLPEYQITAVVWMRGMLEHEYGVKPSEIHWRSGGQEQPGRHERTPLAPIPGLDLKPLEPHQTLVNMLRDGELDALFTARGPSSFLRGEAHIKRLWPDFRSVEQAYYKKTRHFPIMH